VPTPAPAPPDAGADVYRAAREAQIEARSRLGHASVLFLGDSITDGLQRAPAWQSAFAPLGAADFGVAGATAAQVLSQVQSGQVAAVTPDMVVLLVGTNDLGRGRSPAETAAGVAAVVHAVEGQLPQAHIVLVGLLPRGWSPADPLRAAVAEVNRLLAPLADGRRVAFLDTGAAFLRPDGTITPAVMADALHPTVLGYQIYAAALRPLLPTGPAFLPPPNSNPGPTSAGPTAMDATGAATPPVGAPLSPATVPAISAPGPWVPPPGGTDDGWAGLDPADLLAGSWNGSVTPSRARRAVGAI
jgi:beta-glucosidase